MEKKFEIYDKASKTWIPVSEAVHKEYYKSVDAFRRKERRHEHCVCPSSKYWFCDCDCVMCKYFKGNESLDKPTDNEDINIIDTIISDQESIESTVEKTELLSALHTELEKLSDEDFKLCQMVSQYSQSEVARKLGITRSAFRWRWEKVQKRLAEKLEKFF